MAKTIAAVAKTMALKVDTTLAQLSSATVLSKFDANSRFW